MNFKEEILKSKIVSFISVILFFLTPLIFFTNLTRNPYFFQITILNVFVSIFVIYFILIFIRKGYLFLPSNPSIKIYLLMLFVFLISSINSYFSHLDFYRPSIISEFRRVWFFTLLNSFIPFLIAHYINYDENEKFPFSLWFIFLWGVGWFLFPYLKSEQNFFDAYSFFLWIISIIYLTKKSNLSLSLVLNLFMLSGFYASVYGIMQYFGIEIIWSKLLNPYGGRPVSTFGNPNFISSYVLMLFPISFFYFLKSSDKKSKLVYFIYLLSYLGMIFASMTRSSFIGLFSEIIILFLFKDFRDFLKKNIKISKRFLITFIFIFLLWPDQNLKPFSFGVIERVYEGIEKSVKNIGIKVDKKNVYPSYHQRLLIWKSGIEMFIENPILGNGWGSFELFYPFYQANFLREYEAMRNLRTHANNAHNEIIEILSQTGILGFGIWVMFIFMIYYHSAKFIKLQEDIYKKIIVIVFLSSIGGMLVDNLMNVSIHFATPAFLFYFITGILVSIIYDKYLLIEIKKIMKYIMLLIVFIFIFIIYFWYLQFMREVYYFEGFKLVRKGNIALAINSLEKAYSYNNREVNCNYELANAYARIDEYEKAIYMYSEALKANAGYDEIYFNLGVIQKKKGLYNEAANNLRTSIWINPLNEKAYYAFFEVSDKNNLKDLDEISNVINDGIKIHKYNSYLLNIMGYIEEKKGNILLSSEYYKKAVENDPLNKIYLDNYLRTSPKNRDFMIIDFVNLYKMMNSGVYDLGLAKGEIDKLEKYFSKNLRFLYLKARYFYDIKNYSESEKILKDIIYEDSSFYSAKYALGIIYEVTNRPKEAILIYEDLVSSGFVSDELVKRIDKLKLMK